MDQWYKVAGIDVHKKMLAVVIANVAELRDGRFERRRFGTEESALESMAAWFAAEGVVDVVMESTAQYWKPVWQVLEESFQLHLAQAQSNRGPKGRKSDFTDAERLVRRHVAGELILSFVPEPEQRLWRMLTRSKRQLSRDRARLRNQIEGLLEDCRIKLSSHVSDLMGGSGMRMLRAIAEGETDATAIAGLAGGGLRASQQVLMESLVRVGSLDPARRQILQLYVERIELIDSQMERLAKSCAESLREHQDAIRRLASVPGLAADTALQVVAEVGPKAMTFPSPESLASWVGACPGREESAEVSKSDKSPKGNRTMRRILNQSAKAAIRSKGSVFQDLYRRLVARIGHPKAIWAVAHKLCRIIWKILHDGVEYQELGRQPDPKSIERRTGKLVRQLRALGYQVQLSPSRDAVAAPAKFQGAVIPESAV